MNDLEIERLFDGELPPSDRRRVLDALENDPEARLHLNRLTRLRELARRHDPAGKRPEVRPFTSLPHSRPWRPALAAAVAAVALLSRLGGPARVEPVIPLPLAIGPATRPIAAPAGTLEVELYRWANAPGRVAGQAARLVLSSSTAPRKRSPADEILALELANAPPKTRGDVRRFAAARTPRSTTPARPANPGPRPRTVPPTA
jgi:hypothetical protein